MAIVAINNNENSHFFFFSNLKRNSQFFLESPNSYFLFLMLRNSQ